MPLRFAALSADTPTSVSGTVDLTDNAIFGGDTPSGAALLFGVGARSGSNPIDSDRITLGLFDGSAQMAIGGADDDDEATTETSKGYHTSKAAYFFDGAGTLLERLSASWVADGLRLTLDGPSSGAVARRVGVLLIDGATGEVKSLAMDNSGTEVTATFANDVDAAIVLSACAPSDGASSNKLTSFGVVDSNGDQFAYLFGSRNGRPSSDYTARIETDACCGQVSAGSVDWTGIGSIVGDEVRINPTSGNNADVVLILALSGVHLEAKAFTSKTGSVGTHASVTGLTKQPSAYALLTTLLESLDSTATDEQSEGASLGFCDGTNEFTGTIHRGDADSDPTNTQNSYDVANVIDVYEAVSTNIARADHSAWSSTEITFDYSAVPSTTAIRGFALAFAELADATNVRDTSTRSTAEKVSITQNHVISVRDTAVRSNADSVGATQVHVISVRETSSRSTSDKVPAAAGTNTAVRGAAVRSNADSVGVTQVHVISVRDASSRSASDKVPVTGGINTSVRDTSFRHTAAKAAITQVHVFGVRDASSRSVADKVLLGAVLTPTVVPVRIAGATTTAVAIAGADTQIDRIEGSGR